MIKLIATDMDGTLLNSNNEIQHGFYDVFEKIQEKGIIFAAASGRQYYNLLERFKGIEDKMMFIAENGTFVVYEELVVNSLDINLARELIKVGRQIENSYVILCGKNSAYIESCDKRLIEQTKKYYARYEIVSDLTKIEDDILKDVTFEGGCSGNLIGIKHLIEGKSIDEIIEDLEDIPCKNRGTSCPDQLAKALKIYKKYVLNK